MVKCKICGYKTKKIIDFGKMPIANGFVKDPQDKEYLYNLFLVFCPSCFMVQLGETVKATKMFHNHYQFISSTSRGMEHHFKKIAGGILNIIKIKKNPFVIELGCNDGIMLKHLAKKRIRHLGIEPSKNVAELAKKNKVKVLTKFFDEKTAREIVRKHGKADIVCGANVICHIENINSVFAGIAKLLNADGVFFFEEPYIYDIIKKTSFDQIYDEHVYYYSGLSVAKLAEKHGLNLINMEHQDVHGGSMRYYIKKLKVKSEKLKVKNWINKEKQLKLDRYEGYLNFKDNVDKISSDLKNLLIKLKKQGERVVGYAATSKSTTLLNYAKIGPELIDYISDTTPSKIGKHTPGTHISIKSYNQFKKDNPPYSLLFAWNHKKEIFDKERKYLKYGGKFITYFPKVKIE